MQSFSDLSDQAILAELGQRIARYRLNRNLTQETLATEAGISLPTVQRIERGNATQATNLVRVLRVLGLLDNLGALVPAPAASPVQQAKRRGKQRKRASSKAEERPSPTDWTWGDDA